MKLNLDLSSIASRICSILEDVSLTTVVCEITFLVSCVMRCTIRNKWGLKA